MKPTILNVTFDSTSENRLYSGIYGTGEVELEDNEFDEGDSPSSRCAISKEDIISGNVDEIFLKIKNVLNQPGGLVAIPTETVYGLAGNIYLEESLKRIFEIKSRPFNDPLIVHVDSFLTALEDLYDVNMFEAFLILYLASRFAPGPLTIVAKCKDTVSPLLTNDTGYLGVRCPNNELCLSLLKFLNIPLAAPSANKFGHISPTCAEHVYQEFPDENIHILDGGKCEIGIESTVIKVSSVGDPPVLTLENQDFKYLYKDQRETVIDLYGELNKFVINNPGRLTGKDVFQHERCVGDENEFKVKSEHLISTKSLNCDPYIGGANELVDDDRIVIKALRGRIDLYELLSRYKHCRFKVEILRKGAVTYEHLKHSLSGFKNVDLYKFQLTTEDVKRFYDKKKEDEVTVKDMCYERENVHSYLSKYVNHEETQTASTGKKEAYNGFETTSSKLKNLVLVKRTEGTSDNNYDDARSDNDDEQEDDDYSSDDIENEYDDEEEEEEEGDKLKKVKESRENYKKLCEKLRKFESPGMSKKHYAPNVPTYLVEVTRDETTSSDSNKNRSEEHSPKTSVKRYYGDENFYYEKLRRVDCSRIIMIDVGRRFINHSGKFKQYLPLDNEPKSLANQLYSTLRRAESHALESKSGDTNTRSIIAINYKEKNANLHSAIRERIKKSTSQRKIYAQITDEAVEFSIK